MVKITTSYINVYKPSNDHLEGMQRIIDDNICTATNVRSKCIKNTANDDGTYKSTEILSKCIQNITNDDSMYPTIEVHSKCIQKITNDDPKNKHDNHSYEKENTRNDNSWKTFDENIQKIKNNNKDKYNDDLLTDSDESLDFFDSEDSDKETDRLLDGFRRFREQETQKKEIVADINNNKNNNNNKKTSIETNLSRSFSSLMIRPTTSSSNISMLNSPKLTRRNLTKPRKEKQKAYTADDLRLTIPTQHLPVGGSDIDLRKSGIEEEDRLYQRNSYILSPRVKRKQIDITTSPAYKEIYASNLRLYSAVLAKQIASTGQIGREMNEIRRNKIKRKALNVPQAESMFHRSQSVNQIYIDKELTGENEYTESETPEQEAPIQNRFHRTVSTPVTTLSGSSNQENVLIKSEEHYRMRSKSALEPRNIKKNSDSKMSASSRTFENMSPRKRAATIRSEALRQKLRSLDVAMNEADKFLDKVKNIATS